MGKIKEAASTAWSAIQTGKFWKELFVMTFGMAIAALGVNYFLVPGKLIVGSNKRYLRHAWNTCKSIYYHRYYKCRLAHYGISPY